MNAKAQFLVADTWGYKQENSQFYSGMVGDLQRGRAEIGGINIYVTNIILHINYLVSLNLVDLR